MHAENPTPSTAEIVAALRKLYEFRHLTLARAGAAGHRFTSSAEWVCDPWTQAFKDAGAVLANYDKTAKLPPPCPAPN
jgi:hypothetical protein